MRAAALTVPITPRIGSVDIAGYGFGRAAGVLDALEAQVLVLEQDTTRVAMIAADLLAFGGPALDELGRRVWSETGIPRECLIVAASHSHSAPTLQSLRQWGPVDPEYAATVVEALADAVSRAAAGVREVRVACHQGNEPGLASNRRAHQSVVDGAVPVVRIEEAGGRPLAVLYGYGCHPVTLHSYRNLVSPDYPGYARKRIRRDTGAPVVMFALGPSGDVNPAGYYHGRPTEEKASRMGETLGDAVVRASGAAAAVDADLATATVVVDLPVAPLPSRPDLLAARDAALAELERARGAGASAQVISEIEIRRDWAADALAAQAGGAGNTLPCRLTAFAAGKAAVLCLPLELFASTGLLIRERSPFPVTLIATNTNGCLGYLPTADAYETEDYTNPAGMAPKVYGVRALAPGAEPLVRKAASELLESIR